MALTGLHTIMLPVRGDGKGDNVLAHAAIIAKRFGARVRVIHCHPKTDDMMPYGVVVPQVFREQIESAMRESASVTEEMLLKEFRVLADTLGLAETDHKPGMATARFIEFEGKQIDAVRHYGRLSDLVCVPQPDPKLDLGMNTLKSALFSSGRPVMMCPPQEKVDEGFADHVAIAWNGSLEAARAIGLAMPFIANASQVTILSARTDESVSAPEELQRYLELHEIASTVLKIATKSSNVGHLLLSETQSAGAGTLVMGAYHDSYERESVFGGNSQVVVQEADFPVIMVH